MEFFKRISKSEARKDFLQLLNQVASNLLEPILLTDHGKPQAVLLSFPEYQVLKFLAEKYKKENKSQKPQSLWGGLTALDKNLEKSKVWDEVKDDWEAQWQEEFGSDSVRV